GTPHVPAEVPDHVAHPNPLRSCLLSSFAPRPASLASPRHRPRPRGGAGLPCLSPRELFVNADPQLASPRGPLVRQEAPPIYAPGSSVRTDTLAVAPDPRLSGRTPAQVGARASPRVAALASVAGLVAWTDPGG